MAIQLTHQIVLDTNVLVAALRSRRGASHRLLMTIDEGGWKANISVALALEYEDVLKRGITEMTAPDVDDFLDYLFSRSNLVPVFFRWRPALPDADDDRILEVAVRSRATIVTFNQRDFTAAAQFGVQVISPGKFLAMMEKGR